MLIKPGPPWADALAVNVTGLASLKQIDRRVRVLVNLTGSSDIGVGRTQCNSR